MTIEYPTKMVLKTIRETTVVFISAASSFDTNNVKSLVPSKVVNSLIGQPLVSAICDGGSYLLVTHLSSVQFTSSAKLLSSSECDLSQELSFSQLKNKQLEIVINIFS